MKFTGFPARSRYTPLPNILFSDVLPRIEDIAELKILLVIMWRLYSKRGYPRFVTYRELLGDQVVAGLGGGGRSPEEALRQGLEKAVERGTLIQLRAEKDGEHEEIYLLNSEEGRRVSEGLSSGQVALPGVQPMPEPVPVGERPNIFELYEQNIGMLTPMIADELKQAEADYPPAWVEDAFKEAVSLNKRSWRYIQRILERWAAEGKDDGEPGRHPEAKDDTEKYFRGKYGHIFQR